MRGLGGVTFTCLRGKIISEKCRRCFLRLEDVWSEGFSESVRNAEEEEVIG